MVWATYGPFLLLSASAATVISAAVRMVGSKWVGTLTLALSSLALIGAGYIVAQILLAAVTAGATVNPLSTLSLEEMEEPEPEVIETFDTIDGTDLRAAIYRPALATSPAPVIVYIRGGGFQTGTFTETAADLRWFADEGWLVVSIEYRLFSPGNPTWDQATRDADCGVAWAAQNAARCGGDPGRIPLLGDSAG